MKALQTARICVIDDEENEYVPLIIALAHLGLGCWHVKGTKVEELPSKPISGLRLVFLDMNLETAGGPPEVAAHTANVFGKVVDHGGGPILVVLWTKRGDLIEEFKTRLFESFPTFLGRLVFARMNKPVPIVNIENLEADVRTELSKHAPLDLVWHWEKAVHDAASETTSAIAGLAAVRAQVTSADSEEVAAQKSRKAFTDLLRTLLDASAGQNAIPATALRDLFDGWNPLLADRLDHELPSDGIVSAQGLLTEKAPALTADERGALNAMLLVASNDSSLSDMPPGCLLVGGFEELAHRSWLDFVMELAKKEKEAKKIAGSGMPVLVELSPSCDFAQQKRPVAKLMAGILVPTKFEDSIKKADFLRILCPIKLENPQGLWLPVFNSRYLFSISPPHLPTWVSPIGRLRDPLLVDLRNWHMAQAARVGYLYV